MKQHTRGLELDKNLQTPSLQQSLMSADLGRCADAIADQVKKCMERDVDILSSVKQIQDLVLRREQASAQSQRILLEQADQLSRIDTRLSDILSSSAQISSALLQRSRGVEAQVSEL